MHDRLNGWEPEQDSGDPPRDWGVRRVTLGTLVEEHPLMRPVVVDGLLRVGETMNVVAPSKVGKSWLTYSLLISIVTGRRWLGRFDVPEISKPVLLLDNELHASTIAHRIPVVAKKMAVDFDEIRDLIEVVPIRGMGITLANIGRVFDSVDPAEYSLIVGDAFYRLIPPGISENDNSAMMGLFNTLDSWMAKLDTAWAGIMHSTKGSQTEKNVVDVGAGAGSQSRAADTHLIMRAHEEPGVVVVDAAVRSFAPIEPFALRWQWPLWIPADDVDPELLKGRKTKAQETQDDANVEADGLVLDACTTWQSMSQIHKATGMGVPRCTKAVRRLMKAGFLESQEQENKGNPTTVYRKTIHAR